MSAQLNAVEERHIVPEIMIKKKKIKACGASYSEFNINDIRLVSPRGYSLTPVFRTRFCPKKLLLEIPLSGSVKN